MESQIKKIHKQLLSKEISCTALVQEKLTGLAKNTHNTVNSLLDVTALDLAAKVDAKIARGKPSDCWKGFLLESKMCTCFKERLRPLLPIC